MMAPDCAIGHRLSNKATNTTTANKGHSGKEKDRYLPTTIPAIRLMARGNNGASPNGLLNGLLIIASRFIGTKVVFSAQTCNNLRKKLYLCTRKHKTDGCNQYAPLGVDIVLYTGADHAPDRPEVVRKERSA
jgi:hypothetical protein